MAERLTIKKIAELYGVSAGTVDRILHNRGMVSKVAYDAVQSVLKDNAYDYNIHTSAVAFKKTGKVFDIIISIPYSEEGEYWDIIRDGLESGLEEYKDIPTNVKYIKFNQFSALSCRTAFDEVADSAPSAVILGTTFNEEVERLCNILDGKKIPYFFVDGMVENTNPTAHFMASQPACGRLLARLMDKMTPSGGEIAILLPKRIATTLSTNSRIRLEAFKAYFQEHYQANRLKETFFSADNPQLRQREIDSFLKQNPSVRGIAAVISTSYMISDAVSGSRTKDICIGGFDVTKGNARCLREESLDFVIDQHPALQGFKAVEAMLHSLLYGSVETLRIESIPINVVLKENLE